MLKLSLALALALGAQWPVAPTTSPQAPRSVPVAPQARRGNDPTPRQLDAVRELIRAEELAFQSNILGGTYSTSSVGPQASLNPFPVPGVFNITLSGTGTDWDEHLLLGIPTPPPTGPTPVLVMFHGFGRTENNTYVDGLPTFTEALNRGWYVIAPRGAHAYNYGIHYAQTNIEFALTWFSQTLNIDQDRIYGVGFSMGGGGVLSYAARHQDPDRPRFAAVVNHTGGVSTALTYWNSTSTLVYDHPDSFGGSPASFPFLYSQASCVDIDQSSQLVNPNTDLARNLSATPVLNHFAEFDPLANLVYMTQTIFSWLGLIPGMQTALISAPLSIHHWSTLDEINALDFLSSHTLQIPSTGQHRVLADRDGKWFHFDIQQDTAGAFTPFRWDYESGLNRLTLDQTENLARIVVDSNSLGINTTIDVEVIMGSSDGAPEETQLSGYASAPQLVLRNGTPTLDWSWDLTAQRVTLNEVDPSIAATWKIIP
jgi:pimeloyl-ACP methyl ester carboxylesterase